MLFNPIDFDISKLAVEVRDELAQKYNAKRQKVEVQVGNYSVHADRDKIHQVLINLVDNAIKYTQEESVVDIRFNQIEKILVTTVSDNGPGVKTEDMNRLFGKFERLNNPVAPTTTTTGTGLGLYLSKTIVEKSGGEIRAESELGKGTKFIFTLPIN